jgi:hypothetical protein
MDVIAGDSHVAQSHPPPLPDRISLVTVLVISLLCTADFREQFRRRVDQDACSPGRQLSATATAGAGAKGPFRAIKNARAAHAVDPDEPPDPAARSSTDQLGKLASRLQQRLITRDEFEHLKAKLIAES